MRKQADSDANKQSDFVKKQLGAFASLVEGVSPKLAASLAKTFAGAGEALGPVLVGVVAGALPVIGATIAGAVIGGVGIGGVIGGVLLAAQDARVNAAGKQLGQRLLGNLQQDASPFIQPVLDAIDLVESRFNDVRGNFQNIFRNSASFVRPLVDGITRALQSVIRGVDSITSKAGPVIDAIAFGIAEVGAELGGMLDKLSNDAPAAAVALRGTFDAIAISIRFIGGTIDTLTRTFGLLAKLGLFGPQAQQQMIIYEAQAKLAAASTDQLGGSFQAAAAAADQQAASLAPIAPDLQAIAAATREVYDQNNNLFASQTSVAQAVLNATKTIKENGRTLDLNTEAGLANRAALSTVRDQLQKQYDNYVAVNGAGGQAAVVADNLRGQFIKLAEKAGLSAGKAKALANSILDIPDSHDTKLRAQNEQALEAAREVRRAINSVQSKTVTITIARRVTGSSLSDSALSAALRKNFDTSSSWAATEGGTARTGGPVEVNSTVENRVYLDGQPFRAMTSTAIRSDRKRTEFRDRVGRR